MALDESALENIRQSLQAEDYHLDVTVAGQVARVTITAGPSACADCLVGKDLMRAMLSPALGVPAERIELAYPADVS